MTVFRLVEADVFEVDRLAIDADYRRRNPVGKLARLDDASHQAGDELAIALRRQPFVDVFLPLLLGQ